MKILIACEESQAVTIEFRNRGFEAYSCDILPCSGGHPEWHIQDDVRNIINDNWDAIIAFPPCTYLTVTGNAWLNIDKYGQKALDRYKKREEAIEFFMMFANNKCLHIAIENPVGIMNTIWKKPSQIIHPYYFGDPYEKRTCLWLKNLPTLIPTKIVKPEPRYVAKSGKTMAKWFADLWLKKEKEKSKIRSKTFPGVAKAMAEQWGSFLINFK